MQKPSSSSGVLVLTLKYGESIQVGDAEIRIRKGQGQQIKISIKAPKEMKVLRSKLLEEKEDGKTSVSNES